MASAMPRYLVIPLEVDKKKFVCMSEVWNNVLFVQDVDFVGDAPEALPVVPLSRFRRAVEEEPVYPTLVGFSYANCLGESYNYSFYPSSP